MPYALLNLISTLITIFIWLLIAQAVLSWLLAFGVVNRYNRVVTSVSDFLWRITEPALLAVKATRFPGQELRWDAANFRFTNHDKANNEILSRNYREGFAPPTVA